MLSAIVIVGPEIREEDGESGAPASDGLPEGSLATAGAHGLNLAWIEVLGRSVVGRVIDELRRAGVNMISVLGAVCGDEVWDGAEFAVNAVDSVSTQEAWCEATRQLMTHKASGVEATLIMRIGPYLDLDLTDAFRSHFEQGRAVTRAFTAETPLDIWFINPSGIVDGVDILTAIGAHEPARYFVSGYVNKLENLSDLRRLVVDALSSRCLLRPYGSETRLGVWMGEGAQVHRDARIVAPAFVGRDSQIAEQCLITRCSNVEANCQVDYGTVVEDTSILPNSYVGIGLDISHAIVDGNSLLNLERNVALDVSDPLVIRPNKIPRKTKTRQPTGPFYPGHLRCMSFEES